MDQLRRKSSFLQTKIGTAGVALASFLILLNFSDVISQNLRYQAALSEIGWNEGIVTLTNEIELKGLIKYDDKKGTVSFESNDKSKTFVARQILGFEYFDQALKRNRIFYSLAYADNPMQNGEPFIFEILKEFKTFAVLYKSDPEESKEINSFYSSPSSPVVGRSSYTQNTQRETIYLFPADGKITPLLEMSFRQTEGRLIDLPRTKSKLVNRDILINCLGDVYSDIEIYSKQNKFDFKKKEDLMKIFDYYERTMPEN